MKKKLTFSRSVWVIRIQLKATFGVLEGIFRKAAIASTAENVFRAARHLLRRKNFFLAMLTPTPARDTKGAPLL